MSNLQYQLRLGNIVQTLSGTLVRVESMNSEGINLEIYPDRNGVRDIEVEYPYSQLQGVPLSVEWAEKIGLKYTPPGRYGGQDKWAGFGFWIYKTKYSEITFRGNYSRTRPIELKLAGYFNTDITYLHHLTNLLQDLTGEEITIEI